MTCLGPCRQTPGGTLIWPQTLSATDSPIHYSLINLLLDAREPELSRTLASKLPTNVNRFVKLES